MSEIDKLRNFREERLILERFLEWLTEERGICLAEWSQGDLYLIQQSQQRLLMDYAGIDLNKLEDERQALLDEQRLLNECWTEQCNSN